jgi:hypothetical protein
MRPLFCSRWGGFAALSRVVGRAFLLGLLSDVDAIHYSSS